ncbi:MAG: zeta toxin family protein [Coriobacteriia bacterium]|nr:zeta toxin family protein [Coriobacteriia bacterium]
MDKLSSFTPDELGAQIDIQLYEIACCYTVSASPYAVLLGGQSGAGKTLLQKAISKEILPKPVIINGDEFRKLHPRFELLKAKHGDDWVTHTAPWSGKMTESLIDKLSKLGYNLIIEGTLRTSEVPLRTATLLRERGYEVSLALMAVKPEISLISCQIRYEEMRLAGTTPRATDPAHHAKIVNDIVDNLSTLEESELFDQVYLYTRSEECLYPADDTTASAVLRERLFGEWTPEERAHYEHLKHRLESLKR